MLGRLKVDPPTRRIGDGARNELLEPRVMRVLVALASAKGKVLSRDDLIELCWDGQIVGDNAINRVISRLRLAFGRLSAGAVRIETITKVGFRLVAEAQAAEAASSPAPSITAPITVAVAVLPFDNLSGDPHNGYLADGLAEELISTLARIPGLKVPARTSTFAYRGKGCDIRTIARELGVDTVLEGSVRAGGERLRVSAQLIDAGSGYHLWAETFDRALTDLLDLQDDLAQAIATALRRELGPRLRETNSAEAMRLVLEARAAKRSMRAEGLREAVQLARQALELDPSFAKAWESLAESTFVINGWGFERGDGITEAHGYARRAIELDARLGTAHAILGSIEATRGRFVESVELLERALELEPSNFGVANSSVLSTFLPTGLVGRATGLANIGINHSLSRPMSHLLRSSCAALTDDWATARHELHAALQLGRQTPHFLVDFLKAEIALAFGDRTVAADAMARLIDGELSAANSVSTAESILASIAGDKDPTPAQAQVLALFDEADRAGTLWGQMVMPGQLIRWSARLGNFDDAFAMADRIIARWRDTGRLCVAFLTPLWFPDMTPFRRDPRFQDLIRELGLIRFWDRYGPPDGHALREGRLVCL